MEKQVTKFMVVIVMILILGGVALYSYYNKEYGEFSYNGFAVQKLEDSTYQIKVKLNTYPDPQYLYLRNSPVDVENIPALPRGKLIDLIIKDKDQVYFTMHPQLSSKAVIAALEVSKYIANQYFFNLPVSAAMTKENRAGFPVITCENVTDVDAVIFLKIGKETRVYSEENCIIIEGTDEDELIRAADALSLRLIGIIQ